MKTILVISFTDQKRDPRVSRHLRILAERYQVTSAGYEDPEISGVQFIKLETGAKGLGGKLVSLFQLLTGRYESFYFRQTNVQDALAKLRRFDLVIANDLETLPLSLRLGKVLFDAHEYAPEEYNDLWFNLLYKPYRKNLCKSCIPKAAAMITVSPGIAELYFRDTGVRSTVIMNLPDFVDLQPSPPGDKIRLVHHGIAMRERKIEKMIEMMSHLDNRYELNFFLVDSSPGYVDELKARAKPQIRFHDPVSMHDLPKTLHAFDIGVYLLDPGNINNRLALPNKLFEFIQARLAIAVSPSPEMARIVQEHRLGAVASDFSPKSLAEAIRSVDIASCKSASHRVAREFSTLKTREILTACVQRC